MIDMRALSEVFDIPQEGIEMSQDQVKPVADADAICKLLPWDSAHFGMRIARVQLDHLTPASLASIERWLKSNPVDCLYFLATPQAETLRLAAESGFRFVDTRVTLECDLTSAPLAKTNTNIRPAVSDDLPVLTRIASESHHDSRFYVDGNFPPAACDELYRIWITKAFENRQGVVFVAELGGKAVGYSAISASDGDGIISLIAIDAMYRGRAIATHLMNRSETWFRQHNVRRVHVPTQASNVPALRLYESQGFKVARTEPWFHRWF
jgi:dTDP-4-amino-4,6-dideoxy-D-galactose acyltransferase